MVEQRIYHHRKDNLPQTQAELLTIYKADHLSRAANIINNGGIAVVAFNGIYGIFGDLHNTQAAERIVKVKNRPHDKKLVSVSAPENLDELADFSQLKNGVTHEHIITLQQRLHALGVILPSRDETPDYVVSHNGEIKTILSIWTEYPALRYIINELRETYSKTALVGTSANRSGQATHRYMHEVWADFQHLVDGIVLADFSHLDESRGKSTSVIDLTGERPRLHRAGNVTVDEINDVLRYCGLKEVAVDDNVIFVKQRS